MEKKCMRYVHWLKIDGYAKLEETAKEFFSIEEYLKKYPKAKALLYEYDSGSFNWIVKLECEQNYNGLDLDVESFSSGLRRLSSKPRYIGRERKFSFPEHYRKYIS